MNQRGKPCPTCGRIPVSGKTWSILTQQDELIKRLKAELSEARDLKDAIKDRWAKALGCKMRLATVILERKTIDRPTDAELLAAALQEIRDGAQSWGQACDIAAVALMTYEAKEEDDK